MSSGDIAADIDRHLAACRREGIQAFPMGASIAASDFCAGIYRYQYVFSYAKQEQIQNDGMVLPPGEMVAAVCTENDGNI